MTILHFKVVLAAIFSKININNRKTRPYSQFYSLVTSKYVPLMSEEYISIGIHRLDFAAEQDSWQKPERLLLTTEQRAGKKVQGSTSDYDSILRSIDLKIDLIAADSLNSQHLDQLLPVYSPLYTPSQVSVHTSKQATCHTLILCDKPQQTA